MELEQTEQDEIARLIKDGYTEGRLDAEDGRRVYWKLQTEIWKE